MGKIEPLFFSLIKPIPFQKENIREIRKLLEATTEEVALANVDAQLQLECRQVSPSFYGCLWESFH